MATLTEVVTDMATLVKTIKTSHRLTENTILRIIDMNLAISQNRGPAIPDDSDLVAALGIVPDGTDADPTDA